MLRFGRAILRYVRPEIATTFLSSAKEAKERTEKPTIHGTAYHFKPTTNEEPHRVGCVLTRGKGSLPIRQKLEGVLFMDRLARSIAPSLLLVGTDCSEHSRKYTTAGMSTYCALFGGYL